MRIRSWFSGAFGASLLLGSVASHATTLVTYDIVGFVSTAAPAAGLSVGDPFSARLTYDLDAPVTSSNAPNATYSPATPGFSFSVGVNDRFSGGVSVPPPPGIDDLQITNGIPNGALGDRFRILRSVTSNVVSGVEVVSLDFNLQDLSGDNPAFVGLGIPGVLLLADYDVASVFINTSSFQNASVMITSITLVPIPAALPLFLAGLAGLGVIRRRKSKIIVGSV